MSGVCPRASPRVVVLEALQLVPLLGQRGLHVQVGAIVRQLQRAVIELWGDNRTSL